MSEIPKNIKDDINQYCKLNNIENIDSFITKIIKSGFDIEKYGLLNDATPKIIEKEVEKIIYRDVIKEVPVIEYIEIEKPIEVIKEIPVESQIVKEVFVENKEKQKALENTIQKLRNELIEKNKKISELENLLTEIKTFYNKPAIFLNGSNLDKPIK